MVQIYFHLKSPKVHGGDYMHHEKENKQKRMKKKRKMEKNEKENNQPMLCLAYDDAFNLLHLLFF